MTYQIKAAYITELQRYRAVRLLREVEGDIAHFKALIVKVDNAIEETTKWGLPERTAHYRKVNAELHSRVTYLSESRDLLKEMLAKPDMLCRQNSVSVNVKTLLSASSES